MFVLSANDVMLVAASRRRGADAEHSGDGARPLIGRALRNDLMHALARYACTRVCSVGWEFSKLTLWVSRKPQRKYRVARVIGRRLIHLPLAAEVSPRVGLLVEAEDLHGGGAVKPWSRVVHNRTVLGSATKMRKTGPPF
jgi:hypothetical protein